MRAKTASLKERNRARVERGVGDVLVEPGTEMMSRWRFDMRTHLVVTPEKTQHEEDRMRDIRSGKRGSEAAGEEHPDKLRRQYDLSKKLRVHQRLPIQLLPWNIRRVVKHEVGWSPYLCRSQVMFVTTYKFLRCIHSTRWMDERVVTSEKWYRGEDAGDLKRSELHELVENLTCLNALDWKIWKSDQKVVMDEKINPKIVMNEDSVQNDVMDGKFVKNFVMKCQKLIRRL